MGSWTLATLVALSASGLIDAVRLFQSGHCDTARSLTRTLLADAETRHGADSLEVGALLDAWVSNAALCGHVALPETRVMAERFARFVADRHPFALRPALEALDRTGLAGLPAGSPPESVEGQRPVLRDALGCALDEALPAVAGETTPRVPAAERIERAGDDLLEERDGFLIRERITASLTRGEKRELLRGMLLTRATDNRLKTLFTGGEPRFEGTSFQGEGFRSLGQEAIYAAPLRLHRGEPGAAPTGTGGATWSRR